MSERLESWAIILSAGKGTRMKSDICKQYMLVEGKPLLFYTLKAFEESEIDHIVLVVGENDVSYVQEEIVDKYKIDKVYRIVIGGHERYDSVMNGLDVISDNGKVLVHDGARPLIETEYINQIIDGLNETEACIAAVPVKDTIKEVDEEGFVKNTPDRRRLWQVQTPQAFSVSLLKSAYSKMKINGSDGITDDSMVVEKYTDTKVRIVECSYSNIKITTPEDLDFMKQVLESRK
ncbi:MAG: 2-C-methyl-D-erythritol 4-phosphate cytidylyltransferase [Clostridiales bacterium]|nr:2-C-methyl-D-erythritol 4-phosphate cytidylyltransferase [Clostridiales bacterium]MDD6292485.1 2-C-methyl-D-erythritol 4-phosphate cytidylyltransferase [Eubacteriales bacterium]